MSSASPIAPAQPATRRPAARSSAVTTARAGAWLGAALWAAFAGFAAVLTLVPAVRGAIDGLAQGIALLTLFVAAIVTTFSRRYMRADARPGRFFAGIALLVASVLVFACAGNLLVLAAGWCASGLLLARLIGHAADWAEARRAARRARAAFALGDAALLAALALLGLSAGTVRLDGVLAAAPHLPPAIVVPVALLLVVAAAARCALPPFAGWLLSSMTAPTPVSALMHAGLVNAGGFLLIRFAPLLEAAPLARGTAIAAGLVAALYGVGVMSVRPDVKRALAGSTVSQMGFMIMSCGLGAYAAALWHLVAHGLFKAWLFLGSGSAVGAHCARTTGRSDQALLVAAVALVTLALAGWLVLTTGAAGSLVPLLLGLATAVVTLLGGLRGDAPLPARLAITALVVGLAGFHTAGLALARHLIGPDAAPPLPGWALLILLAGFLAAWVWQQSRQARAAPLPPALYIRLLNAGANRAP
ncbi:MAG: hypothetical protein KGL54_02215 [Sphingomonadales bacterium]|nr:hypothetical protein [Sphingomonadales bacterium]